MTCREQKKLMFYLLGELRDEERKAFRRHVDVCPACSKLLGEFEQTGRVLEKRRLPAVPDDLLKKCLRKIENETQYLREPSVFEKMFGAVTRWPRPVVRWATIVVVFLGGLGLGKCLFDPPTWWERYEGWVRGRRVWEKVDDSRYMRNYLLSVETLLLDLTNMGDPALLDGEEWEMEVGMIREVLRRSRQIEALTKDRHPELNQLVTEIRWVLEDVLGAAELDLAGLSGDVRQDIEERGLLVRIHDHLL